MDGCRDFSNSMSQEINDDVIHVKPSANTNTATWPDELINIQPNNYLVGKENEECVAKINSEFVVIKAQDRNKDVKTYTCSIAIPDNIGLSQTANISTKLKLCIGDRIMLSDNISVSERLINGSIGTVEHLDRRSKQLRIAIYVKFDDSRAGNFLKITGLW